MTRILFLDTETTGKDPNTARMVELALLLVEVSPEQQPVELSRFSTLVQPDEIDQFPSAEATGIHGITGDEMLSTGIPLDDALELLTEHIRRAKQDYNIGRLVCHNIRYDVQVLANECRRREAKVYPLNFLLPFCTMKAMESKCCIPGKYGNYKWPTLREAWEYTRREYNGEPRWNQLPGNAHRAAFDVDRCSEIYFHGLQQGWWHRD